MSNRYRPTDIAAVRLPITSRNTKNARKRPIISLGTCTSSQLFSNIGLDYTGTVCVLGNPARGINLAETMIRRSQKPFLLIGPASDRKSAFSSLNPTWILDEAQQSLPSGNGAILLSKPYSSYLEFCEFFEEWSHDFFIILHLSGGVQAGSEIMNLLGSTEQCLIFSDSVPQSLRNSESRTITPKEFLSQMSYLIVFSSGVATKDLIELLPTYQYEKASNTMNYNNFKSHSIFNLFHSHKGHGMSLGQTRTMEYKKSLFEMDELQNIFNAGVSLIYSARANNVYLADII